MTARRTTASPYSLIAFLKSHLFAHCEGTTILGGGFPLQGVQTLAVGDFAAVVEEALANGAEVAWREVGDCLQAFQFVLRQRALE